MRDDTFGGLRVHITGGTDRNGGGDGPVVVLLHGYGAPGSDLVVFGRTIDAPRGTRFVFPEAPIDLGREYEGGRAWWHIDMMALQVAIARGTFRERAHEVPPGLAEARALVDAMLDDVQRIM